MTDSLPERERKRPYWDHLELARLSRELRERAARPVNNTLPEQYVKGFGDGMRCAADVLDALVIHGINHGKGS